MSAIEIVFHSGYGHTKKIAEAVLTGASQKASAQLIEIDQNGVISEEAWTRLENSKMIVFGTPTYMGMVSWQFKKFADASSKPWFKQMWKNKWAAGFTNSATMNGDKFSTVQYLFTLSQQHSMLWVGTGMMPSNRKDSKREDLNYVGGFAGLITTTPSDASPDEMNSGDLKTAEAFGLRLAEVVGRSS